jgi:NTP pyrophosphatase (non-canonical NTP hydrolase)
MNIESNGSFHPGIVADINLVAMAVHRNAREKGFHDDTSNEHIAKTVANIHGEVSEFWEAYRKGQLDSPCDKNCDLNCAAEELADIIIRVMDTAVRLGVDIGEAISKKHDYNTTRPFMHGGKAA